MEAFYRWALLTQPFFSSFLLVLFLFFSFCIFIDMNCLMLPTLISTSTEPNEVCSNTASKLSTQQPNPIQRLPPWHLSSTPLCPNSPYLPPQISL